ncbi:hypothetical protein EDC94DRAFT_648181 [Helicostylum pulchrum]|nr:hypothetical protein EDC94DRAFT_648181 [Helicostylum pulchrum]
MQEQEVSGAYQNKTWCESFFKIFFEIMEINISTAAQVIERIGRVNASSSGTNGHLPYVNTRTDYVQPVSLKEYILFPAERLESIRNYWMGDGQWEIKTLI